MRDLEYEINNIGYDHNYQRAGIKCKNYIICNAVLPEDWYNCKGNYLCMNCDCMFGRWQGGKGELRVHNNEKCPLCQKTTTCIEHGFCDHWICINCFKRRQYGDEMLYTQPIFPYPEIENEYYDDQDDKKWFKNYPLIKQYQDDYNTWFDIKEAKQLDEDYLRKCPVCKKGPKNEN